MNPPPIVFTKKGFVLLYALLVSSIVLVIGLTLSNLIVKQLIISSISREMNQAYYAANTARECGRYLNRVQNLLDSTVGGAWDPDQPGLDCSGGNPDLTFNKNTPNLQDGYFDISYSRPVGAGVDTAQSCGIVEGQSAEQSPGIWIFQGFLARGYNSECNPAISSSRRVERVLCQVFDSTNYTLCTGLDE